MLPTRLVDGSRTDDGRLVPRWLGARDEPWLRELAAEIAASAGRTVGDAEERILELVAPLARRHGVRRTLVEATWTVERRRWKTRIASPVPPAKLRKTVFELAAERTREEALTTAAALLGIDAERIEGLLFADRPHLRVLRAPDTFASASELGDAYNLALVQALIARSTEVTAVIRANLRRAVGYAKLLGLLASFEDTETGGTRMTVSGPLALFHDTIKYGHALARWLPVLTTTPGWSLTARVALNGETSRLELDASAPLPRVHAMPPAHDSKLEERLEEDLRRLSSAWRIEREPAVVRGNGRLFFPDFALVSERGRVLVEVAGFWTTEYVAGKVALLRAARIPLVLCLDARRACPELVTDERVLPFDKRIDAATLVARCEQLLMSPRCPA